jgi:hypothetical protein
VARKKILGLANIFRKLAFSNIYAPEKLGNFSYITVFGRTFTMKIFRAEP